MDTIIGGMTPMDYLKLERYFLIMEEIIPLIQDVWEEHPQHVLK